jgi:hypothetical protein
MLLIGAAHAFVGFGEDHPGRSRGRVVHRFLTEVGVADGAARAVPWATAFAHHLGYWSHFNEYTLRSSWPLPLSASCAELAAFAGAEGVLAEHPVAGDLFLLWSPAEKAFVHTGIIVKVDPDTGYDRNQEPWYECITIEGDTNTLRARRGGRTLRQVRVLSAAKGDRFVRWTALEGGERGAVRVDVAAREGDEALEDDEPRQIA